MLSTCLLKWAKKTVQTQHHIHEYKKDVSNGKILKLSHYDLFQKVGDGAVLDVQSVLSSSTTADHITPEPISPRTFSCQMEDLVKPLETQSYL